MVRAVDTCFVAMTRPTTYRGVVFEGHVTNCIVTAGVTIFVIHSPPGFLLGVLVHFAMREVCRSNPHFFWQWRLYLATKAKSLTKHIWGGSRLQPSPIRVRKAAEMPTGA
jgi:type IV secretory pathway VirB3-like protein